MEKYRVSCVIPSYKRCDTVLRAINSVLNQTYTNIEVLLVDDNIPGDEYSDKLKTVISAIADTRFHYILQEKHINGAEARNVGIRAAHGDYIAFLDDDDVWLPTKIEKQLNLLLHNPNAKGVSCLYSHYNESEEIIRSCPCYDGSDLHRKIISREVAVFTSTVLLDKNALLSIELFNNKLERHQDLQLLLDFTSHYDMVVLNEYLAKLYIDSNINRANSVSKLIKIKNDFFKACKSHFDIYSGLERRTIYSAHYFEILFAAIKGRNIAEIIRCLLKIGLNINAYSAFIKRYKNRKFKLK